MRDALRYERCTWIWEMYLDMGDVLGYGGALRYEGITWI